MAKNETTFNIQGTGHAVVSGVLFQFTYTDIGVIARKAGPGLRKFNPDTNLIAVMTESGVSWRKENKLRPEHAIHFFETIRDAERFVLR